MDTRRFELQEHAEVYARFRPQCPTEAVETIVNHVKKRGIKCGLAVDLGCGSGQNTVPFAPYFDKVIGVDISEAQLSKAPKDIPNLEFHQSAAEKLDFLEDGSVDLVVVANGLHWFNFDSFYPEVKRVLRPGGTFSAFSFGILSCVLANETGNQVLREVTHGTLKEYWHKANYYVASKYEGIPLPFQDSLRMEMLMKKELPISAICGYIQTNSFYQLYLQSHPDSTLLPDLKEKLQSVYMTGSDTEVMVNTEWPIAMLFGWK